MKVGELITKLQEMPQELEVVLSIPQASDYGWEFKESEVKSGYWMEGHFFSEETIARWRSEDPSGEIKTYNPAIGIEVGE